MPEKDSVEIRDAYKNDLKKIQELDLKCFKKPWPLIFFQDELKHPESFIKLSTCKSRICGFIVYRIFMEELQIYRICCKEEFRKKGIATGLLNSATDSCKSRILRIFLEVASENTQAIQFYKKNGFQVSGVRNNYYGQGINALNMTKELPGGINGCKNRN